VSERLPREGNFDGKTLLQVNCGNSGELEIALNPRRWTRAHHDAWHRHIPDVHKAFAALLDVAKQRTDPSATQHDFKLGEVVIISGLTGPNAMFNGRHVIGGGNHD
jgi:hypothetical protein